MGSFGIAKGKRINFNFNEMGENVWNFYKNDTWFTEIKSDVQNLQVNRLRAS